MLLVELDSATSALMSAAPPIAAAVVLAGMLLVELDISDLRADVGRAAARARHRPRARARPRPGRVRAPPRPGARPVHEFNRVGRRRARVRAPVRCSGCSTTRRDVQSGIEKL
jgi:hypothetical protein